MKSEYQHARDKYRKDQMEYRAGWTRTRRRRAMLRRLEREEKGRKDEE